MTPILFLVVAGPASLFIGILGILEPAFSTDLWFDATENIVHTGFGIVALLMTLARPVVIQRFVLTVSVLTLFVAIGGLLVADLPAPNFLITNLEHPMDNALHFTFAITGLFAAWRGWLLLKK